jgi:predicted ferric reductase
MKDPTFWILARASGLTAYVLITVSMLAGLVVKSRPFGAKLKAASAVDAHRFLTSLALGAVAVHAATLVLDSSVQIGLRQLLVPFTASYRPLWTGLGVLAAELAIVVAASFSLRKRIGGRAWRRLHWATYAIFALATAHGLAAGTDTSRPWVFDIYLGSVGAVAFATAWRALTVRPRPSTKGASHVQDPDRPVAV